LVNSFQLDRERGGDRLGIRGERPSSPVRGVARNRDVEIETFRFGRPLEGKPAIGIRRGSRGVAHSAEEFAAVDLIGLDNRRRPQFDFGLGHRLPVGPDDPQIEHGRRRFGRAGRLGFDPCRIWFAIVGLHRRQCQDCEEYRGAGDDTTSRIDRLP
jgi:hypothetical protein